MKQQTFSQVCGVVPSLPVITFGPAINFCHHQIKDFQTHYILVGLIAEMLQ